MNNAQTVLEFDKIKEMLSACALTLAAKEKIASLSPYLDERKLRLQMEQTTGARRILDALGSPPISPMEDMQKLFTLCEAGAMLTCDQLLAVAQFDTGVRRMASYLKRAQNADAAVASYGLSLCPQDELSGQIETAIRGEQVLDAASGALRSIRRKMDAVNAQVKAKLESLLKSKKQCFADSYVSSRGGRFVLPVKKEFKNQIPGQVVDVSKSGGTCFIEPAAAAKLSGELARLLLEEDNEVRKVLYALSALVEDCLPALRQNLCVIEDLDFMFAKAKLSAQMRATEPTVDMGREIHIKQGRHPLLPAETCVPLDFDLDVGLCGVVITGPNTGGKTVAEKTVGLLCMMAQCGLHIPAEKPSRVCMRNAYLADIGDGQSISENLSTFSAHITNIKSILETATSQSFVILDELGSGTDPAEGMGIAAAVLEELVACGCLFLVTTHYPEIKEFAEKAPGILNARMAFDKENLRPLYRLELGVSGESAALYIAKRLGLSSKILRRAWAHAYPGKAKAPAFLEDLNHAADNLQKGGKRAPAMICDAPPREAFDAGFSLGDSVQVLPQKETGIVFAPKKPNPGPGEEGLVGVQVKGVKKWISHKRLRLHVAASQLYPPDYDFSILFDTVKNRKARRKMEKGHQEGLTVVQDPDYPQ